MSHASATFQIWAVDPRRSTCEHNKQNHELEVASRVTHGSAAATLLLLHSALRGDSDMHFSVSRPKFTKPVPKPNFFEPQVSHLTPFNLPRAFLTSNGRIYGVLLSKSPISVIAYMLLSILILGLALPEPLQFSILLSPKYGQDVR